MSIDEDKSRAECAEEWMIRLDTADPEEQAAFYAWLGKSPANIREFIDVLKGRFEIARAVSHSEALTQMVNEARGTAAPEERTQDMSTKAGPITTELPTVRIETTSPRRLRWAIAASAVLATVLIAWAALFKPTANDVLVTDAGEWARVTLEDGSTLFAAPRTRLVIQFSDETRRIRLEQGTAMFHVATDPKRPFLVESTLGTARAVGTKFSVSLDDATQLRVDVQHGLVAVARHEHEVAHPNSASTTGPWVTLKGGEEVIVTRDGALTPKEVDIEAAMAWTNRRLVFKNHTVDQAVREFNRLNRLQIHVLDRALRQHILSGSFDATDPESLVAYLKRQGDVEVYYSNPETLLIVPKSGVVTMEASK